ASDTARPTATDAVGRAAMDAAGRAAIGDWGCRLRNCSGRPREAAWPIQPTRRRRAASRSAATWWYAGWASARCASPAGASGASLRMKTRPRRRCGGGGDPAGTSFTPPLPPAPAVGNIPEADAPAIATKGGLVRPGPGRWDADGRPEHLREACEGSLRRLRLEQIPLYQFHRPHPRVPLAESLGALTQLKDEGKIRHIGVSNVSVAQLRTAQRLTPVVSVQNRYNGSDRKSEQLVDVCEQEQIAFLPWAPIQQAGDNPAVTEAAKRHGASPRQIVLAWLLARSPQMLPIPGTGSPEHAEANVAAAAIELTPDEVTAITQAA